MSDLEPGQFDIEAQIASRKNEVVARLTDAIVHDFRNLFLVMEANTDLVSRGSDLSEETKACVRTMTQAVRQGKQLADRLLPLSRESTLEPEVLSLRLVALEAFVLARKLLPPSLAIDCAMDERPMWVRAGRGELLHAILGVVLYVRDEMPDGTLTFETSQSDSTKIYALSLIARPHISTATASHRSIAIVESQVRSMGGTYRCATTTDSTTFTIALTAHSSPAAAPARRAMGSAIVVEPEPLLRAVFCSILQQLGFDATGVATLESLSSKTLTHISLLLLQHPKDQAMLFKILSASAAYPQTQFVIAVDSDDSLPAHSANLVVIRKPFQLEEMATALSIR